MPDLPNIKTHQSHACWPHWSALGARAHHRTPFSGVHLGLAPADSRGASAGGEHQPSQPLHPHRLPGTTAGCQPHGSALLIYVTANFFITWYSFTVSPSLSQLRRRSEELISWYLLHRCFSILCFLSSVYLIPQFMMSGLVPTLKIIVLKAKIRKRKDTKRIIYHLFILHGFKATFIILGSLVHFSPTDLEKNKRIKRLDLQQQSRSSKQKALLSFPSLKINCIFIKIFMLHSPYILRLTSSSREL